MKLPLLVTATLLSLSTSGCLEPIYQSPPDAQAPTHDGGADAGPDTQTSYEYPGCANEDDRCPRLPTFYCAIRAIQSKYDACSAASDCAPAEGVFDGTCTGIASCGELMVNQANLGAFSREVSEEVARYCPDRGGCRESGSCAEIRQAPDWAPDCVSGRCQWTRVEPDGGDAGGGTGPQQQYTYQGCEDAGTYGCPNDLTFYCALDTIEARYNACSSSADCVLVDTGDCVGYTSCVPAAVSLASRATFEAEAATEVTRYCSGATCMSSGSCAEFYDSVACIAGRCVAVADAGM